MVSNGNGVFKMEVDSGKKVLIAFAEGFFSMEQGLAFTEAFIDAAHKVSKYGDYSLVIDAKGVKPSTPDVSQALGKAMALYVSDDFIFRKRFMTKLTSAIAQVQVERLAKGIPGFSSKATFVDSKEEALKMLKSI